ncbi:Serine/threonine-protein kinase OSR1 [Porphyridium purpureum]|uniref:Serine/threonine-protein kinase OSR1 n=1 Tax=Porphyridium purpureum TaxID=35688 RepID=A0A5J4Z308_PORPP|nr:Serine/threonine-protein kinase OSR1 [Porphyridium purpureum]|eukprot:POR4580..scf208_2
MASPSPNQRKMYPSDALHYELREQIGQGSTATVYRAWCDATKEEVAIKVYDLEVFQASLEEIGKEIQVMSLSSHPNVLPYSVSFVHGHDLWVVMPLLTGGSVLSLVKNMFHKGLDENLAQYILHEALRGLEYFHSQGQMHRDIKAGNILLDSKGNVMLSDYGVMGWMVEGGLERKVRQTFVGTPCWMAPEVMEQVHGYDYKADIWSFGITAIEIAQGSAPYMNYPPMKVLLLTLQNPPPSLEPHAAQKYSKGFREMLEFCLQKDPKKRPTAAQMLRHKYFKNVRKPANLPELIKQMPPLGSRAGTQRGLYQQLQKVAQGQKSGIWDLQMKGQGWDFDDENDANEADEDGQASGEQSASEGRTPNDADSSFGSSVTATATATAGLRQVQRINSQDAGGGGAVPTDRSGSDVRASAPGNLNIAGGTAATAPSAAPGPEPAPAHALASIHPVVVVTPSLPPLGPGGTPAAIPPHVPEQLSFNVNNVNAKDSAVTDGEDSSRSGAASRSIRKGRFFVSEMNLNNLSHSESGTSLHNAAAEGREVFANSDGNLRALETKASAPVSKPSPLVTASITPSHSKSGGPSDPLNPNLVVAGRTKPQSMERKQAIYANVGSAVSGPKEETYLHGIPMHMVAESKSVAVEPARKSRFAVKTVVDQEYFSSQPNTPDISVHGRKRFVVKDVPVGGDSELTTATSTTTTTLQKAVSELTGASKDASRPSSGERRSRFEVKDADTNLQDTHASHSVSRPDLTAGIVGASPTGKMDVLGLLSMLNDQVAELVRENQQLRHEVYVLRQEQQYSHLVQMGGNAPAGAGSGGTQ